MGDSYLLCLMPPPRKRNPNLNFPMGYEEPMTCRLESHGWCNYVRYVDVAPTQQRERSEGNPLRM